MMYTSIAQRGGKVNTPSYGGDPISNIMDRIKTVESSGNYQAIGPETAKGDVALGAYQVMDKMNLANWSREALGREVSRDEFLDNPELQDQIVRDRMSKIYDQYGNEEDVASVWFSGRPVAKAGNAADVTGTSVPEYIKRFRNAGGSQSATGLVYTPLSQRNYS